MSGLSSRLGKSAPEDLLPGRDERGLDTEHSLWSSAGAELPAPERLYPQVLAASCPHLSLRSSGRASKKQLSVRKMEVHGGTNW